MATNIGGLLIAKTGSVLLTAEEAKEAEGLIDSLKEENKALRWLCEDLWQLAEDYDGDSQLWQTVPDKMDELGLMRWD